MSGNFQHTQKYAQTQKHTPQIMIFGAIMASGTPPRRRRFDVLPASFSCILLSVCARANVWEGCKRLCVWICLVQYYIYTNTHNTHTRGEGAREGASERERSKKMLLQASKKDPAHIMSCNGARHVLQPNQRNAFSHGASLHEFWRHTCGCICTPC